MSIMAERFEDERGSEEREIEERVHTALRELAPRRAPASLLGRVQAELERRTALPWWRRRFGEWPSLARVGFVVASLAVAGALVLLAPLTQRAPHDVTALPGAGQVQALLTSGAVLRAAAAHLIPSAWLGVGLVLSGALYALLFGLGAVAYRTLYLQWELSDR